MDGVGAGTLERRVPFWPRAEQYGACVPPVATASSFSLSANSEWLSDPRDSVRGPGPVGLPGTLPRITDIFPNPTLRF